MKKQLLIVSSLSLVLSGCSVANNVKQQVENKAQDVAMEQAIKVECSKVDKDTCDVITAQVKTFSRSNIMTSTTGTMKSETKMDGKGNMQIVSSQNGKEDSNMIIFNNATYVKDYDDGKWMKLSGGDDSSLFDMKAVVDDVKESFNEENTKLVVKELGEEACEKLTCTKYETYESDMPEDKTLVWVDTKEKLVRKMETKYDKTTTVITYTYDSVTIGEPSPIKEFTAPQVPAFNQDNMPSMDELKQMMQDLPEMPETGE